MNSSITFTSTFSKELMAWIKSFSEQSKKTKRQILEEAILRYKDQIKKQKYTASFKRASLDQDMIELSEMGFYDYSNQIKNL